MTQKEVDILLDKFEAGNCSAEEELLVDEILAAQAEGMGDVYGAFVGNEKASISDNDVQLILQAENGELNELLETQATEMGSFYSDFVASAKSEGSTINVDLLLQAQDGSLDEILDEQDLGEGYAEFVKAERAIISTTDVELVIQAQDGSLDEILDEQDLGEVYAEFVKAERAIASTTDVELVIQAHTGGLDELLDQQKQGMDSDYEAFIEGERKVESETNLEDILPSEKEAKVVPLGSRWKKYSGIAAVFVVALAAIFLLQNSNGWGEEQYADGMSADERIEAELALEQTLAALGFTKNKLDKGTENMKLLKSLRHTEIFK